VVTEEVEVEVETEVEEEEEEEVETEVEVEIEVAPEEVTEEAEVVLPQPSDSPSLIQFRSSHRLFPTVDSST